MVASSTEQVSRKAQPGKAARRSKHEKRLTAVVPNFDAVIHERMRLGIVSALAINDSVSFSDLKRLLKTTDGNLSVHARKLEEAGYLGCSKFFEGRMPRTEYRLTPAGRQAFEGYLRDMERMIRAARER